MAFPPCRTARISSWGGKAIWSRLAAYGDTGLATDRATEARFEFGETPEPKKSSSKPAASFKATGDIRFVQADNARGLSEALRFVHEAMGPQVPVLAPAVGLIELSSLGTAAVVFDASVEENLSAVRANWIRAKSSGLPISYWRRPADTWQRQA